MPRPDDPVARWATNILGGWFRNDVDSLTANGYIEAGFASKLTEASK